MCAEVESSWAGVGFKDLDTWFRTSVTFRVRALDWTAAASVHFCMAISAGLLRLQIYSTIMQPASTHYSQQAWVTSA